MMRAKSDHFLTLRALGCPELSLIGSSGGALANPQETLFPSGSLPWAGLAEVRRSSQGTNGSPAPFSSLGLDSLLECERFGHGISIVSEQVSIHYFLKKITYKCW